MTGVLKRLGPIERHHGCMFLFGSQMQNIPLRLYISKLLCECLFLPSVTKTVVKLFGLASLVMMFWLMFSYGWGWTSFHTFITPFPPSPPYVAFHGSARCHSWNRWAFSPTLPGHGPDSGLLASSVLPSELPVKCNHPSPWLGLGCVKVKTEFLNSASSV